MNEDYLPYLLELDKKLLYINQDDIAKQSQSKRDLEPALEKLRIRAVTKVGTGGKGTVTQGESGVKLRQRWAHGERNAGL